MKARLMFRDQDFGPKQAEPFGGQDLMDDLGLDAILKAMSGDDQVIRETSRAALLSSLIREEEAQLLAQCGMFAPAARFTGPVASGIFTHFKREEDKQVESGKLDEELGRMSRILGHLKPGALILFNESFASTNEREGSEIARQITQALVDSGMEVVSVTHLYEYASGFQGRARVLYLSAERLESGKRTFLIVPGNPLETGFGEDVYRQVFEA